MKKFVHKYGGSGGPADSQWAKWLAKKKENFDPHVPNNEKTWFIVRVDYKSSHPAALELIAALSASPNFTRSSLFVDDMQKNAVGPQQKKFDTFDKERSRQAILRDAERTVITDMFATERSTDGSHVRFLIEAFFFMIIPVYDKPHDLQDAEQFLWVRQ